MADSTLLSNIANPALAKFNMPSDLVSLQDLATRGQMNRIDLQNMVEDQKAREAEKQIARTPGAFDTQTGMYTPVGLNMLAGVSPRRASEVQKTQLMTLQQMAQQRQAMTQEKVNLGLIDKREQDQRDEVSKTLNETWANRYDLAKKAGASDDEAQRQAEQGFQEEFRLMDKQGKFPWAKEGEREAILGQRRDINAVRSKLGRKELMAEQRQDQKYEERDVPLPGDMIQKEYRDRPGDPWKPLGKPSHKFGKQVLTLDQGGSVQATEDTLEMDAYRYLTDGTLPPNMGRGMQGTKQATQIRNRASELAKHMGMGMEEIRFAQLENKTKVAALGQLAKAKAQILQFEKTAEANAELALNAAREVWRSGSPWFNRPLNIIKQQGTGDPKFAVFNAANETFVNEYARVMSGGYGAAQTTEGAQQRAHTLLNTSMNQPQYEAVVKQLKAEMKNREKALNDQMQEERDALRGVKVRPMRSDDTSSRKDLIWSDADEKRLQELERKRAP